MRILHYFLGPRRQGGLNRYVCDLAVAQAEAGHQVMLLYPVGEIFPSARPTITEVRAYQGIAAFQLRGGLPVPLLEGVRNPEMILANPRRLASEQVEEFYERTRLEVLHVHTWMGFPPELLETLKSRGVRIIFTTHDYYGLCPKVNFVDWAGLPCGGGDDASCSRCNAGAPGERRLSLRNSEVLLRLKGLLAPCWRLLNRRRPAEVAVPEEKNDCRSRRYSLLRVYYIKLLEQCDCLHCNSLVAQEVYRRYLPQAHYGVLPITHGGIHWQPRLRKLNPGRVCLGFSGPDAAFKGLPLLLEVLASLPQKNWHLAVWGGSRKAGTAQISYCGRYSEAGEAFQDLDLLIVPSVWNETFGFLVAEALSLGLPVLCSDTVGAKGLVEESMVFHGRDGLRQRLGELLASPRLLEVSREHLVQRGAVVPSMAKHAAEMLDLYSVMNP